MSAEGIGARVTRKEDKRFITGKGKYTDDVRLHGMTYASFVRSPHAHAKIKSINIDAAKAMPGVVDVLTGQQIVDDKVGNLICGWMIHSKDGSPMKMAPHPALAAGKFEAAMARALRSTAAYVHSMAFFSPSTRNR